MAVVLYMPSPFDRFKREGDIVGRLVVEYGELEWDLCLLVACAIRDQDTAIKVMYRARGEAQRIALGDALARKHIPGGRLRSIYEMTIARLKDCTTIRNRYAHTVFSETADGRLAFLNLEDIANEHGVADTSNLPLYELSMTLIEDEARLFVQVAQNLRYLNWEMQALNGQIPKADTHMIEPIARASAAVRIR